jgi:hypothetical protein
MQTQGVLQFEARFGTVRKQGEESEFYGAQQCLAWPKPKANLQYVVWRNFVLHLSLPDGECSAPETTLMPFCERNHSLRGGMRGSIARSLSELSLYSEGGFLARACLAANA